MRSVEIMNNGSFDIRLYDADEQPSTIDLLSKLLSYALDRWLTDQTPDVSMKDVFPLRCYSLSN